MCHAELSTLIPVVTSIIHKAHSRTTPTNSRLVVMDAGKINKIDQSLQSVIIAYQHNAENRAVPDLASHYALPG